MRKYTYQDNFDLVTSYFLKGIDPLKLKKVVYKKGDILINEGDSIDCLTFVLQGKIKISQSYENGKTLLLQFTDGFTILGDIEYFLQTNAYCTVEAITDVSTVTIPLHYIDTHYRKNIEFLEHILIQTNRKVLITNSKSSINLMYPLETRLASYLLSLSNTKGLIQLPNLSDVANHLGTSYRHLHRTFKELQTLQTIHKKNKTVTILDRKKLLEIGRGNIYERKIDEIVIG